MFLYNNHSSLKIDRWDVERAFFHIGGGSYS